MPNRIDAAQVSDTTEDDSSNAVEVKSKNLKVKKECLKYINRCCHKL